MKTYVNNLWLWLQGLVWIFTRAVPLAAYTDPDRQITYKPGWGPWKFLPVYLLNYGTKVLTGGPVSSWSQWFHRNRDRQPWRFFDRLLNSIDSDHGKETGPSLWGSQECKPSVRCFVTAFWLAVLWLAIFGFG